MNLLLIAEIMDGYPIPEFGPDFERHMAAKRNPEVYNASCTAWRLLALALKKSGMDVLPQVQFEDRGKPVFTDSPLHFSLSHSGKIAAALLSNSPCAVDVEAIRDDICEKLTNRCMNEQEKVSGCSFFECWTKKECLGKLSGKGIPSHPAEMDSLHPAFADHFHLQTLSDPSGRQYMLAALCMNHEELNIQKIRPEELR